MGRNCLELVVFFDPSEPPLTSQCRGRCVLLMFLSVLTNFTVLGLVTTSNVFGHARQSSCLWRSTCRTCFSNDTSKSTIRMTLLRLVLQHKVQGIDFPVFGSESVSGSHTESLTNADFDSNPYLNCDFDLYSGSDFGSRFLTDSHFCSDSDFSV